MATLTLSEAMSRIEGYLDKVSKIAEAHMSEYIQANAKQGYATGALASSIDTRLISESERGVGSSLHYAKYVDEGRGEVVPRNKKALNYFDTKLGVDVVTKRVGPMKGIDFIEETKKYIESTYIPL